MPRLSAGCRRPSCASPTCVLRSVRRRRFGILTDRVRRRAGFFSKSDIKKNYTLGDQLGSGNFAVVRKGTKNPKHQQGAAIPTDIAVKIIDKAKVEDMGDIQREIEIMQMIDHKNVIKLFEIYDEPKKMMLVMELVRPGQG